MKRILFATIAVFGVLTYCRAQEALPVSRPHPGPILGTATFSDGPACATGHCATGNCGTCSDCLRVPDIKKTQVPVYSCKEKEICIPNCGLFGHLFGCKGECQKIVVRQLVKRYRTDEECVMKCMTAAEAAKKHEADAKKAAESMPPAAPAPNPAKLPKGMVSELPTPVAPGAPVQVVPVANFEPTPTFLPGVIRPE